MHLLRQERRYDMVVCTGAQNLSRFPGLESWELRWEPRWGTPGTQTMESMPPLGRQRALLTSERPSAIVPISMSEVPDRC